jgi:DNA polymerase-3 subunit alpha
LKKIITKNGKPMFFLKTEDLTDKIEIIVFPKTTEKSHSTLKENNIVLISGKVDWKDNNPKIIAEEIEEVIEQ